MRTTSARTLANWTNGQVIGKDSRTIHGVSKDSRTILVGQLYVPLIGETFDGHSFLPELLAKGIDVFLWQNDHPIPGDWIESATFILVENTLTALQMMARSYRETLPVKVVAVTGSNGKTSTKDLLAAILSTSFRVQKTQGNLNNHIGLPLMLLGLHEDTEVAVLEMGMSARGEIALLASLAKPDLGVITNIGESHLEYLGSREGIAEAKFELIEQLPAEGIAFLNGDEPLLTSRIPSCHAEVVLFGLDPAINQWFPEELVNLGIRGSEFSVPGSSVRFHLPIPGRHQVSNALAALAVARKLGCQDELCRDALSKASLSAMRLEVLQGLYGGFVINDAYNASPTSMRAAILMLAETETSGLKVAILGDMLELGEDSSTYHYEIGKVVAEQGISLFIAVGNSAKEMVQGAIDGGMRRQLVHAFENSETASKWAEDFLARSADPLILVKGSRGMKMEKVVHRLALQKK